MSKITSIQAREILASGGAPTLEVTVTLESGAMGEASVSYGASAGSKEATVLLDGDKKRYGGKGMLVALANITDKIAPVLIGMEANNQREIDEKMLQLDGTINKAVLGGNAILGVSMAVARAAASEEKLPLYKYLQKTFELATSAKLPKPMIVMIEGGKHAADSTDLQEYLVAAMGNRSATENVRMEMEIYEELKKILKREGKSTNVGNEGAFAPNGIESNEKPMEYMVEAIKNAGYVPGVDAGISIDAAASEFQEENNGKYILKIEDKALSSEELIEYFMNWAEKYPFVSWEDMLSEYDWENWPKLTEKIAGKFPNIAD
ncbi:MAG TPA: phosphopyruvate hydratase, partial [Candidatus Methanoperedens sp.]|nr:phosphopyruvate hydratase [Candidatus Methanoperedens sp.]